jgi:hypothetical protein
VFPQIKNDKYTGRCISYQQPQVLRKPRRMSSKELSQNMKQTVTIDRAGSTAMPRTFRISMVKTEVLIVTANMKH